MPQIAGVLPMISKIAQPVTGVMGIVSNLIRQKRIDEAQKAAVQRQKDLQGLINNPAALAQKVQQMEQPLNQGLVQGVENQAQAGLAERGLGTSPQIANEVFAQALGPYEQENRMAALRSVLQTYGMDDQAINTIISSAGQPTDTSGFWQSLQGKPNVPSLPPSPVNTGPGIINLPNYGPNVPPPPLQVPGGGGDLPNLFPDMGGGGGGDFPGSEGLF